MSMRAAELIAADIIGAKNGVEESLNVKGTKTVPNLVDVAAIDLMFDVASGGFGVDQSGKVSIASTGDLTTLVGVNAGSIIAVGPTGFSYAGVLAGPLLSLNRENCRVLGVGATLTLDAAGLAAFLGKRIGFHWEWRDIDNNPNYTFMSEDVAIVAGQNSYRRGIPSGVWNGLVPLQLAFTFTIQSHDGTNFPANTTLRFGLSTFKRAIGAQVPL